MGLLNTSTICVLLTAVALWSMGSTTVDPLNVTGFEVLGFFIT
jgi:hypothetical protein